ncbi:MAG: hypothetical protein S4CHLAM37_00840 [Chlamydiia bacterium]|nr:hypothetical protein [Chlamydiia bacterium]
MATGLKLNITLGTSCKECGQSLVTQDDVDKGKTVRLVDINGAYEVNRKGVKVLNTLGELFHKSCAVGQPKDVNRHHFYQYPANVVVTDAEAPPAKPPAPYSKVADSKPAVLTSPAAVLKHSPSGDNGVRRRENIPKTKDGETEKASDHQERGVWTMCRVVTAVAVVLMASVTISLVPSIDLNNWDFS